MDISRFNALDSNAAAEVLQPCADIDRWVGAVVDARPFGSVEQLLAYAAQAASPFRESEIDAALAHHPRIGEQAAGFSSEALLSRGEQAGLALDGQVASALLAGNRAYEKRFSRVFLIRAAGRSSEEILAELLRRLGNDHAAELAEVDRQLRAIALLRLAAAFNSEPAG